MSISEQDRERISAAIRAAEAKTSGEIVCVLAQTSSDATGLPILLAAAGRARPCRGCWWPSPRCRFTASCCCRSWPSSRLPSLLCLPRVRVALLPRAARRAVAHRAAMEQFAIRGIARKKDRTGILIFVSLAERYARIIADEGIAARVPQSEWQGAVDALVAHMRQRPHRRRLHCRDRDLRRGARDALPAHRGQAATSCRTGSI